MNITTFNVIKDYKDEIIELHNILKGLLGKREFIPQANYLIERINFLEIEESARRNSPT